MRLRNFWPVAVLVLVLTAGTLNSPAQSADPSYPTPVATNELTGTIKPRDIGDSRLTTFYYIFGGGHVSKSISKVATLAGFSTVIVDDREAFANAERFPEAEATHAEEYENVSSIKSLRSAGTPKTQRLACTWSARSRAAK